jgi:hypothetical protein
VRVANWQRPKHVGVEDREHRDVQAHTQRDGYDDRRDERGTAPETSHGIAYVLELLLKDMESRPERAPSQIVAPIHAEPLSRRAKHRSG